MALTKNCFLNTGKHWKVFYETAFFQVYSASLEQEQKQPGKTSGIQQKKKADILSNTEKGKLKEVRVEFQM